MKKPKDNRYPSDLEQVIGFNEIRDRLFAHCLTEQGKILSKKMVFLRSLAAIELRLAQTAEMMQLTKEGHVIPLSVLDDIKAVLEKFKIEGYYFFPEELLQFKKTLEVMQALLIFFKKHSESTAHLCEIIATSTFELKALQLIDKVVDNEGQVRRNASKELQDLSWEIEGVKKQLDKKGQQLFNQARQLGHTEETGPTIREGRIVLPVLAEFRRKVKGIVLDESAQGRIAYIEPEALIELNNDLRELEMKRKREVERVLRKTTTDLLPYHASLEEQNQLIGVLDFIHAKARLGIELDASAPMLNAECKINWKEARHPLLWLLHQKSGKPIVPLNIQLDKEQRIVVISGPNAGGKSVCLKTVMLLQYMVQCGLPVPCQADSSTGIFDALMADIGDNQSIDNDLSSYTSHLVAMKHFALFAGPKTLFCIDELGSGTDPQLGGPIAEGVLHYLNKKKALGVVSTHFSSIKHFSSKQQGMVNAAMAYDVDALKPLYQLRIGAPGSSYAFEVAAQNGLQAEIVRYARKHSPVRQQKVEELLTRLEKERSDIDFQKDILNQKEQHLNGLIKSYEQLKEDLKTNKKEILENARQKAGRTLEEANRRISETLNQLRTEEKQKFKEAKAMVQNEEKTLHKALEVDQDELTYAFNEGDLVVLKGQNTTGNIISIKKEKARVDFGGMTTVVQLKQLKPVAESETSKKIKNVAPGIDLVNRQRGFSSEMDIRGRRAEEVLVDLEQWIDNAVILGFNRLRVIHGKGNGILKKIIREHFKAHPFLEKMQYESEEQGGEGVSIIQLR